MEPLKSHLAEHLLEAACDDHHSHVMKAHAAGLGSPFNTLKNWVAKLWPAIQQLLADHGLPLAKAGIEKLVLMVEASGMNPVAKMLLLGALHALLANGPWIEEFASRPA